MIRECFSSAARSGLVLLTLVAGSACHDTDNPIAPVETPDPAENTGPVAVGDTAVTTDTVATLASVSYSGQPYGPIGLWAGANNFEWGPKPFTLSQDNTYSNTIITRINTARQRGQRLVTAMTGGDQGQFMTNGKFDLGKWKRRMNSFNTSAIRNAVAAAVRDGVIIGNTMMDEPETPKWGGNVTKALIDQMAVYAKNIFPSLPMGINHGGPGYTWRASEHYRKLDYVLYQYQYPTTDGNISAWRSAVLSRARADGVTPAFSVNLLNGGRPDNSGSWDCSGSGQAGRGTRTRKCRMTSSQLKDWGSEVGPAGCFMLMWRYDDAYMQKSANVDAFRSVASLLANKSRRSCRRP
ncbi:MAG TPA: hypothetical protein VFN08_02650 [Gemmatimonadales bacterium]|nr:hypothetical protein [Gemmatimonadales bacterium]